MPGLFKGARVHMGGGTFDTVENVSYDSIKGILYITNKRIIFIDADTGREICKYNLSENYSGMTAMIFGEVARVGGEWQFNAIGQPTTDNDITSLARRYGLR